MDTNEPTTDPAPGEDPNFDAQTVWDAIYAAADAQYGKRKWHVDDLLDDFDPANPTPDFPQCAYDFFDFERLPSEDKLIAFEEGRKRGRLFATYKGVPMRVVMASRFGDVGITNRLWAENGYDQRVYLPELQDFSVEPPEGAVMTVPFSSGSARREGGRGEPVGLTPREPPVGPMARPQDTRVKMGAAAKAKHKRELARKKRARGW